MLPMSVYYSWDNGFFIIVIYLFLFISLLAPTKCTSLGPVPSYFSRNLSFYGLERLYIFKDYVQYQAIPH